MLPYKFNLVEGEETYFLSRADILFRPSLLRITL